MVEEEIDCDGAVGGVNHDVYGVVLAVDVEVSRHGTQPLCVEVEGPVALGQDHLEHPAGPYLSVPAHFGFGVVGGRSHRLPTTVEGVVGVVQPVDVYMPLHGVAGPGNHREVVKQLRVHHQTVLGHSEPRPVDEIQLSPGQLDGRVHHRALREDDAEVAGPVGVSGGAEIAPVEFYRDVVQHLALGWFGNLGLDVLVVVDRADYQMTGVELVVGRYVFVTDLDLLPYLHLLGECVIHYPDSMRQLSHVAV